MRKSEQLIKPLPRCRIIMTGERRRKAMTLPQFTAGASLYKTTMHYRPATGWATGGDFYLAPAQLARPVPMPNGGRMFCRPSGFGPCLPDPEGGCSQCRLLSDCSEVCRPCSCPPPKIEPLTVGECTALGGVVRSDATCPETTTTLNNGTLQGHFVCIGVGGDTACIDESA
jgi:hypothetical protein